MYDIHKIYTKENTVDKLDIDILRVLINDCRASYRKIGFSVGLTTNSVKTRISKLVSNGIIRQFSLLIVVPTHMVDKTMYQHG